MITEVKGMFSELSLVNLERLPKKVLKIGLVLMLLSRMVIITY